MKLVRVLELDRGLVAISNEPIAINSTVLYGSIKGKFGWNWGFKSVDESNVTHFNQMKELFEISPIKNVVVISNMIVGTQSTWKLPGIPQFELEKYSNPFHEICDKLINPLDALDSSFTESNELIEKMKVILHDFRQRGIEESENTFSENQVRSLTTSVLEFMTHHEPEEFEDWFEKKLTKIKQTKKLTGIIIEEELWCEGWGSFGKGGYCDKQEPPCTCGNRIYSVGSEEYPDGLLKVKNYIYE